MPSGKNDRKDSTSAAKSAKALQAAKSRSGGVRRGSSAVSSRQVPWVTLAAAAVVVALIAGIAVFLVPQFQDRAEARAFVPSESNQDPAAGIEGVTSVEYAAGQHVDATQRVAYDQSPPFGGPHDAVWATCTGIVYDRALRDENAVHSLEHGAVWVTYDPDALSADQVTTLTGKVQNQPFMLMSPYPGQDTPVALQSWGRQLKLDDPADQRVDHFIAATRINTFVYPEVGATCDNNPATFDPANPPPADEGEPGPDAIPMDGTGSQQQAVTGGTEQPPAPGAGAVPNGEPAAPPVDPAAPTSVAVPAS